ncbi:hypothetical protein RI129_008743 [Pyrocoelia pectoralis]|uniref:Uncharacterized protein n=1 Tax=Pyrocoelia pectoralis TaxID=417401 RepID=A0AAN7ZL95_9COLE
MYSTLKSIPTYKMQSAFFPTYLRQISIFERIRLFKPRSISNRSYFFKFFPKPTETAMKVRDNVPAYFEIIYKNGMSRYLVCCRILSLGSVLFLTFCTLYSLLTETSTPKMVKWGSGQQPKPQENELLVVMSGLLVIAVMLHVIVNAMPIRIYNFPEKGQYIFIFYGIIPTTRKAVSCKLREVRKVEGGSLLPWRENKYEIINRCRIIMLEEYFRRPADYNILIGYQKPQF